MVRVASITALALIASSAQSFNGTFINRSVDET